MCWQYCFPPSSVFQYVQTLLSGTNSIIPMPHIKADVDDIVWTLTQIQWRPNGFKHESLLKKLIIWSHTFTSQCSFRSFFLLPIVSMPLVHLDILTKMHLLSACSLRYHGHWDWLKGTSCMMGESWVLARSVNQGHKWCANIFKTLNIMALLKRSQCIDFIHYIYYILCEQNLGNIS